MVSLVDSTSECNKSLGDDETVVMKQDLSDEELDQATGGYIPNSWQTIVITGVRPRDHSRGDRYLSHSSHHTQVPVPVTNLKTTTFALS